MNFEMLMHMREGSQPWEVWRPVAIMIRCGAQGMRFHWYLSPSYELLNIGVHVGKRLHSL